MDLFASVPDWVEWAGVLLSVTGLIVVILRATQDDDDDPSVQRGPADSDNLGLREPGRDMDLVHWSDDGGALEEEAREHAEEFELREQRRAVRDNLEASGELDATLERLEAEFRRRRVARRTAPEGIGAAPERRVGTPPVEADEYRVWYGTNRKPVDPADPSRGYSGRRDRIVHHGFCDVMVPESHKIGSVGSSALRRLLTWTDDRLKLRRIVPLRGDLYWQAVARQVAEAGKRDAVVFIHGFNVSFEEAAIRAAQIGFDLGVSTMAFFSWPSLGRKTRRAYQSDGQTIGASEAAIADFLAGFAQRSGAEAVHVIVHSMGNQGVLRAMNGIVADAERRGGCRFGQLILAAADVDSDTFETLAGAYRELAERTTLYVSERDLALSLSAWFAEYPRVGLYPPVSVFDGIDTVSVSNLDLTLLGHGYIGGARDVLQDMHRLIFTGAAPPRFGMKERRNAEGKAYWEVGA